MKEGNFREAYVRYTEALALLPLDKDTMSRLFSNRSLAYTKAGRYNDALADADEAVRLRPHWSKAYWRRGTALQNLKLHEDAAVAFAMALQLDPGVPSASAPLSSLARANVLIDIFEQAQYISGRQGNCMGTKTRMKWITMCGCP